MRLIDADYLKEQIQNVYEYEYPTATGEFDEFAVKIIPNIINNAPTVDAEPIRHGHWIGIEYDGYADGNPVYDVWECSECGNEIHGEDTPCYCCDCGAKMDEQTSDYII